MAGAFPPHDDCPVPNLPAIEGSLVSSCEIQDAPPPILEFPTFDFPLFHPTNFNDGCVCLPDVKVTIHENAPEPSFAASIAKDPELGCCMPSLQFDVFTANLDAQQRCPLFGIVGEVVCVNPVTGPSYEEWLKSLNSSNSLSFSSSGGSSGECVFDGFLTFYWPSMSSSLPSLVPQRAPNSLGWGTPLCTVKIVESIDALSFDYDEQLLTLEYTAGSAFRVAPSLASHACNGFECKAQPCGARGTQFANVVYDFMAGYCTGPWAGVAMLPIQACLPFYDYAGGPCNTGGGVNGWRQDVWLDYPDGIPFDPPCCASMSLLYDDGALGPWLTGCSGTADFPVTQWHPVKNLWTLTPYVSSLPGGSLELIGDLPVVNLPDCTCGYSASADRDYLHVFPDTGLTLPEVSWISSNSYSSWNVTESSGTCWFTFLDFEEGLLVHKEERQQKCPNNWKKRSK